MRGTHSSKAKALSNDGSWNSRDENGKLGAKNNLLQIWKKVSESGTWNLWDKSSARFLAQRGGGHSVCRTAMPGLLGQNPWFPILQ